MISSHTGLIASVMSGILLLGSTRLLRMLLISKSYFRNSPRTQFLVPRLLQKRNKNHKYLIIIMILNIIFLAYLEESI